MAPPLRESPRIPIRVPSGSIFPSPGYKTNREEARKIKPILEGTGDFLADVVAGPVKDAHDLGTGTDLNGNPLSDIQKAVIVVGAIVPIDELMSLAKCLAKRTAKNADEVVTILRALPKGKNTRLVDDQHMLEDTVSR